MTEVNLPPGWANRVIAALFAAPLLLGVVGAPFAAEPLLLLILVGILAPPMVAVCLQASSTVILSERGIDMRPGLLSGTLDPWRRGAARGALGLLDRPE